MDMLSERPVGRASTASARTSRNAADSADLKMLEELSLKAERAQPKPTQVRRVFTRLPHANFELVQ